MIQRYSSYTIDHFNSELHGVVHSEPARFIFPDHVIWKLRQHCPPFGGQQKGPGDSKNVDADHATRFASTCVNHFVSPQRVWGQEDIVRVWGREDIARARHTSPIVVTHSLQSHYHFTYCRLTDQSLTVHHPLLYSAHQFIHSSLCNTHFLLNLLPIPLKHTQHLLNSHKSSLQTLISLRSWAKTSNSTKQTPSTTPPLLPTKDTPTCGLLTVN